MPNSKQSKTQARQRFALGPVARRTLTLGLLAGAAGLLVGCGGGGDNPAPPAPAQVPCPAVRIQLFGDSTQAGYDGSTGSELAGSKTIAPHNPTAMLQGYFDATYGAGKVVVQSMALEGTTTRDLIAGVDKHGATVTAPWPNSVNADIVVMNHGINDLTHFGDLEEYKANLQTLATAGAARVVFETPNVITGGYDIGPYAEAMREVAIANGLAVADVYAFTTAIGAAGLPADWAHPNDALYARITAEVLIPTVAPMVAPLICKGCCS